jgi:DNA repair photolyase
MSLVRQMRHGRDYDMRWGERMKGDGPIAELIGARFAAARRRYGLERVIPPLDLTKFQVPSKAGDQLDLFG